MKAWFVAIALIACLALLYVTRLGYAPIYLTHDEVMLALNARSLALTAHDLNARLLPLYINIGPALWAPPVDMYWTAPFLRFAPISEAFVRLPTAVMAVIDIIVMYALALTIFRRHTLALVAATILGLTPAHFMMGRLFMGTLYSAAFTTFWLFALRRYLERGRLPTVFVSTLLLGVGFYTYHASVVMMPIFFVLTLIVLSRDARTTVATYAAAAAGFTLPLSLLVPWLIAHPNHYTEEVVSYHVYDASRLNPLQGARELMTYLSLTERSSVYYNYYNPSFLFFSGDTSVMHSTRQAGIFLLPLAVLIPVGIYRIWVERRSSPFKAMLVAGFFAAPAAATVIASYYSANRVLTILPFAVLIATCGVDALLTSPRPLHRLAGWALVAILPLQFAVFYRDYMTDYRVRSSGWFESNVRGAIEDAIARDAAAAGKVYLPAEIPFLDGYWRLYLLKHGRQDLLTRAVFYDSKTFDAAAVASPAVVVSRLADAQPAPAVRGAHDLHMITEPNQHPSFAVFER